VTEQDLIARVLAGDQGAERTLYDRYVDQVWRMTWRFAGDSDRAADWTQETFIRVFRRLGDFRGESKLGTWIGSIAVSVSLGGLRSAKRRAERDAPLDAGAQVADLTPRRADADLGERLHRAIEALADGYRSVFLLHDVEGYTHEEIGQMLGVTPGTSKAQLHRARGRLRESLAPYARTNGE
jgi:RNA polymerase sigma-70 factor (ECF subfamily)